MALKPSPAQRRKAAIGTAFQKWYLTDGMTSAAAHTTAACRAIAELSTIRSDFADGKLPLRKLKLYARSAILSARFNLGIGRGRSPLP